MPRSAVNSFRPQLSIKNYKFCLLLQRWLLQNPVFSNKPRYLVVPEWRLDIKRNENINSIFMQTIPDRLWILTEIRRLVSNESSNFGINPLTTEKYRKLSPVSETVKDRQYIKRLEILTMFCSIIFIFLRSY